VNYLVKANQVVAYIPVGNVKISYFFSLLSFKKKIFFFDSNS